jgi:hypothetical protein
LSLRLSASPTAIDFLFSCWILAFIQDSVDITKEIK